MLYEIWSLGHKPFEVKSTNEVRAKLSLFLIVASNVMKFYRQLNYLIVVTGFLHLLAAQGNYTKL